MHLHLCQRKFGIAKKTLFFFANKICWLPIKARQSWAIPLYPTQSNMAWFSFSRDSLVTKIFPTLLSRFVNTNLLVSLSYVCQLSKCDAGDTMRCTYVSIFTSASFKICNFDSSKICKDNFNTAFAFETDHIRKKHENAHRPPSLCLPYFLTFIGYICLTFLHCVFSSLSSMHSDPLRFVCQASFNLYTF